MSIDAAEHAGGVPPSQPTAWAAVVPLAVSLTLSSLLTLLFAIVTRVMWPEPLPRSSRYAVWAAAIASLALVGAESARVIRDLAAAVPQPQVQAHLNALIYGDYSFTPQLVAL